MKTPLVCQTLVVVLDSELCLSFLRLKLNPSEQSGECDSVLWAMRYTHNTHTHEHARGLMCMHSRPSRLLALTSSTQCPMPDKSTHSHAFATRNWPLLLAGLRATAHTHTHTYNNILHVMQLSVYIQWPCASAAHNEIPSLRCSVDPLFARLFASAVTVGALIRIPLSVDFNTIRLLGDSCFARKVLPPLPFPQSDDVVAPPSPAIVVITRDIQLGRVFSFTSAVHAT